MMANLSNVQCKTNFIYQLSAFHQKKIGINSKLSMTFEKEELCWDGLLTRREGKQWAVPQCYCQSPICGYIGRVCLGSCSHLYGWQWHITHTSLYRSMPSQLLWFPLPTNPILTTNVFIAMLAVGSDLRYLHRHWRLHLWYRVKVIDVPWFFGETNAHMVNSLITKGNWHHLTAMSFTQRNTREMILFCLRFLHSSFHSPYGLL